MSGNATRRLSRMFHLIADAMEVEKEYLSELDGAIGDADHGITMSIGFRAVNAALSKLDLDTLGPDEVLRIGGREFLNAVGASTGPLYASGFKRAAQVFGDMPGGCLDTAAQAALIEAIAAGIRDRGKGQRGDKTMLDVWLPAAETAAAAAGRKDSVETLWDDIIRAAEAGANATRTMIAMRGRAARVGARSLGHVDPGAASAVCILRAMRDALCGEPVK